MVNSKRKGSQFERDVCKSLSLWVSGGKDVDLFWRSAMSGGRATVQRKKGVAVRQGGDICSVAPEGHVFTDRFYCECKSYKQLQIDRFIILGTGKLAAFWKETKKQAALHDKEPLLIAKQNGFPILVVSVTKEFANPICTTDANLTYFDAFLMGEFNGRASQPSGSLRRSRQRVRSNKSDGVEADS